MRHAYLNLTRCSLPNAANYSAELATVMQRMVLISEIATLSRQPLPANHQAKTDTTWRDKQFAALMSDIDEEQNTVQTTGNDLQLPDLNGISPDAKKGNQTMAEGEDRSNGASAAGTRSDYTQSEKQLIIDLLERWEDPERLNREMVRLCRCVSTGFPSALLTPKSLSYDGKRTRR